MKWTYQKSTHTFLERKICSQIYIISTEMRSQKYVYEQYYLIQITLKLTVWKAMDHKNTKNPIFWYHWILKRLHTCEKGDHIIEIIISTNFICIFLLINISFITPGYFRAQILQRRFHPIKADLTLNRKTRRTVTAQLSVIKSKAWKYWRDLIFERYIFKRIIFVCGLSDEVKRLEPLSSSLVTFMYTEKSMSKITKI